MRRHDTQGLALVRPDRLVVIETSDLEVRVDGDQNIGHVGLK